MLKAISKKLTGTRAKVSKEWSGYRSRKHHILHLKRMPADLKKQLIASELDLTRQKISKDWTSYREVKHGIIYKSPYEDFKFVRTLTGMHKEVDGKKQFFKFHDTRQKIYKAQRNFDVEKLDEIVPRVLDEPHVKGVLVVFEVTNVETGVKSMLSNYITKELMERIEENEETVYEYIIGRFAGYAADNQLKFIYMRIVYEKS